MTQTEQAFQDVLVEIRERMADAARQSGRQPEEITLLAVTKYVDEERMRLAQAAGLTAFGENYPQQILAKAPAFPQISWHLIGHLQRNKVKYIVDKVKLIHSVDSLRLAQQISSEAQKKGVDIDILIEVNVAEEASKFGLSTEEVIQMAEDISKLPSVHIRGLMTVAPFTDNPEDNRPYFRNLKQLAVDIARKNIDNVIMNELSMGMTGDYEVAIEEGATMVRVGTGIFGTRIYTK